VGFDLGRREGRKKEEKKGLEVKEKRADGYSYSLGLGNEEGVRPG